MLLNKIAFLRATQTISFSLSQNNKYVCQSGSSMANINHQQPIDNSIKNAIFFPICFDFLCAKCSWIRCDYYYCSSLSFELVLSFLFAFELNSTFYAFSPFWILWYKFNQNSFDCLICNQHGGWLVFHLFSSPTKIFLRFWNLSVCVCACGK